MQTYPTDLAESQFSLLEPHLPKPQSHPRRQWEYPMIVNAIFYVLDNGITWRAMPVNFPPWQTVCGVAIDSWFSRILGATRRTPCWTEYHAHRLVQRFVGVHGLGAQADCLR
jgi:transposase